MRGNRADAGDCKACVQSALEDMRVLMFDPESDLVFDYRPSLRGHASGLVFRAFDGLGDLCYS